MGRKKKHGNSKYNSKYARELEDGVRYLHGYSIIELCHKWGITRSTYYDWVEKHPQFKAAHEHGQVDYAAFWQGKARQAALGQLPGVNAGMMQFTLKNVDPDNWTDKVEVESSAPPQLQKIEIEVIPPKPLLEEKPVETLETEYKVIENDYTKNISDSEPS